MYQKRVAIGADNKGKLIYQEISGRTIQEVEEKVQKLLQEKAKQAEA